MSPYPGQLLLKSPSRIRAGWGTQFIKYCVHCIVYSVYCTAYSVQCAVCSVHFQYTFQPEHWTGWGLAHCCVPTSAQWQNFSLLFPIQGFRYNFGTGMGVQLYSVSRIHGQLYIIKCSKWSVCTTYSFYCSVHWLQWTVIPPLATLARGLGQAGRTEQTGALSRLGLPYNVYCALYTFFSRINYFSFQIDFFF